VWTRLRYAVFDAEGELVEGTPAEVGLVFGYGVLLPALEQALSGLTVGTERTVELEPEDAYGPRDPAAELEFSRDEFPEDVEEGQRYEIERADGTPAVLRVLGVSESGVVVDLNHPLAGQRVRFQVAVLEARAATADEVALAEAALEAEGEAEEPPENGGPLGPGGLLPAASLLRRGVRG
jgi:FKBP-type peptidyl-prolyl cis-trans isomerase SlyD